MSLVSTPFHTTFLDQRAESDLGDPMRELVVRTSYDKSSRLDVPVFRAAEKMRTVPMVEVVTQGFLLEPAAGRPKAQSLAGPANAVRLAMASDVRFEPFNDVPLHRSYPSPRGLYPAEVHFVFAHGDRELRLHYDEAHHALRLLDGIWPEDFEWASSGCALRLEIVAGLSRIAPLYGDLAVTLCALEAGHLAQQICAALRSDGTDFGCFCAARSGLLDDGIEMNFCFPAVEIRLEGLDFKAPVEADFGVSLRVARYALEPNDIARVVRTRKWLSSTPSPAVGIPRIGEQGEHSRGAQGLWLRSSGYFVHGMHGRPSAPTEVDELVKTMLACYRTLFTGEHVKPELLLLRARPDFSVEVTQVGEHIQHATVANGCVPLSDAFGTAYNIDLQTVPLVVLFSSRLGPLMAEGSSWKYVELLVVSGVFAQMVCHEAAALGFFARPFKGMIEQQLETAFNMRGQSFYSLLLGKGDAPNPCISITSLGRNL